MIATAIVALTLLGAPRFAVSDPPPLAQFDAPLAADAPATVTGSQVCMGAALAIANAQTLSSLRVERDELKATVLKEDPGWLRLSLSLVLGLLAGAALTFGVLDATGHFR